MTALETSDLTKRFGNLLAVDSVDFTAESGKLYGIIGPNGAGKTTFIRCVTGQYPVSRGEVVYNGEDITELEEHQRVRRGISLAQQLVSTYSGLSTFNNVAIALDITREDGYHDALFRTSDHKEAEAAVASEVRKLLNDVGLDDEIYEPVENLPYGKKKRLMIAMAIATQPEFLILDEPVAGLNSDESEEIMGIIAKLATERDLGVLLVEHDMNIVMNYCDEIMVLANGAKIANGTPKDIQSNERVRKVYLG